jgi:hypothetical protein
MNSEGRGRISTEDLDAYARELISVVEYLGPSGGMGLVSVLEIAYIIVESESSALTTPEQIFGMEKLLRKILKKKIAYIYGIADDAEAAGAANVVGERLWKYAKANPREK